MVAPLFRDACHSATCLCPFTVEFDRFRVVLLDSMNARAQVNGIREMAGRCVRRCLAKRFLDQRVFRRGQCSAAGGIFRSVRPLYALR